MEGTRPTHWRHQILVRTCWLLTTTSVCAVSGFLIFQFSKTWLSFSIALVQRGGLMSFEPHTAKYLLSDATVPQLVYKSPFVSAG